MRHLVTIIPARWASTRFPGKPLCLLAGKPVLEHVWERCCRCMHKENVFIATDDERIFQAAKLFGAQVIRTAHTHLTGTDRVAEVATRLPGATHIINVQGDEAILDPHLLHRFVQILNGSSRLKMVTAAAPFPKWADPTNPHMVKVVVNSQGCALYFSRSAIPFAQSEDYPHRLLHIGVYGFEKAFLLKFVSWKPSPLEQWEKLEQLRALENGIRIQVLLTERASISVDTPSDIKKAEAILQEEHKWGNAS
ncbi:MAG: 3-deoxy-manno-octulosonate cytidylyltransferase [Candidatus Xiphinematobacter sp.]|nr:MAG: 3-deoxy-manno-octulosonate cytidylyltransferase [Candidatus Xiphinematobacter sp.]QQY08298.1 MAG: 3-deoxy-manno-octulosonate cytidylyltransferase [Candidatus Xiphinematobacter sp.]QQY09039.1 MAG: 3-deoxy-manno-octulosonate cytidylyltransferase [Candidatus Xiphinematobacter sp.]QQY11259.1 MAG: 3-deoxy-manno-octulosonate cytidylyltransferase [Candidatus Xiphinematobacter sp.]